MQNSKKQTENINSQYQSQHQSVHPSVNTANIQNKNAGSQHQSIQSLNSNVQSNKQSIQQGISQKSSINDPNKPSKSKLMKKSTLRASRNKSPPQITKSLDGKTKISDNSGNDYYVANNYEKDEEEIKKSVNKKYKDILKESMAQEVKPPEKPIGDGFRSFTQLTKAGKNQNGQSKTNQDIPLIHVNTGSISGFNLFAVLDGHGSHGHFVSQFCRTYFIKKMTDYANFCKQKNLTTSEAIYNELKQTKFAYIVDIFNKADIELANQKQNFDCNFSGTTCNLVIQLNKHLICASVGDSRSIMIEDKGDKKNLGIVQLSTDQKPDLPEEMKRIISKGGAVDKITDYNGEKVGPPRVWKAGTNYPGLAMSRSLGDFQAKQCGVVPTPQIVEYTINKNTRYLVICSDGVWEFIQNEQVRDLGNIYFNKNNVGGFCTELIKFAIYSWEQFDIIRDDITVVCVYF